MKHVNIVMAKRDRDSYLNTCLYYLNEANKLDKYHVRVYVVDDSTHSIHPYFGYFKHINVYYMCVKQENALFNKAKLLNKALSVMRDDFDWVSVIDVDMIYVSHFFDTVDTFMTKRAYIVSIGNNIDLDVTENIMSSKPEINTVNSGVLNAGQSQISIAKEAYITLLDIFSKLYNEEFEGWGGEDSELSLRSKRVYERGNGVIDRIRLDNMWYHMWHESRKTEDGNKTLLERMIDKDTKTLDTWLHKEKHGKDSNTYM